MQTVPDDRSSKRIDNFVYKLDDHDNAGFEFKTKKVFVHFTDDQNSTEKEIGMI